MVQLSTCKKYNRCMEAKWSQDWDKTLSDVNKGLRHLTELPQLAFYIFNKNYGYVVSTKNSARWFKNKPEAVQYFNSII